MAKTHNLGYPRIGAKRELKFALEEFWKGRLSAEDLKEKGKALRAKHWQDQDALDWLPVGDFSFYDQVLDMSETLGHWPDRVQHNDSADLEKYFRVARGRSANDSDCQCVAAGEMTKWFDTNYHYIVPEITGTTTFKLNASRLLDQVVEAQTLGHNIKPVIIGPVTYLWLSKTKGLSSANIEIRKLDYLEDLLNVYGQLLNKLAEQGVEWVQIDEPVLVTEIDSEWVHAFRNAYHQLKSAPVKLLLTTYFGELKENLGLLCELPVAGVHVDASKSSDEVFRVADQLAGHKVLSVGVVNGRNIWKTDLNKTLEWLKPLASILGDRLWIAPSCSLLHVPVDLDQEKTLEVSVKNWLAFAKQKLKEVSVLAQAINEGQDAVATRLFENAQALLSRQRSELVNKASVQKEIASIDTNMGNRKNVYQHRAAIQRQRFGLPHYPTTTIGSFPQTADIRQVRRDFKQANIDAKTYESRMQDEIKHCVALQEKVGLDVLVHGEAERNDMVEYFGEQLDGFAFTQFGWVQSYGSRCVKPPIIYGDVTRSQPMTVKWTQYAQSLTDKPMKGMLTGPVTILNWSFVRDDQPRKDTCYQLALAIRQEVIDLEQADIRIIQIDEAALREGLPLRKQEWAEYLHWSVEAFRIAANGVKDETQIHTHMCYSDFNDIIEAIAHMDADVITIETSRSDMELLDAFESFNYPNEIGPGVYDIHSPNTPSQAQMVDLIKAAEKRIPAQQLWVNPDCGLKTRHWDEVLPAIENMVAAAQTLREAMH